MLHSAEAVVTSGRGRLLRGGSGVSTGGGVWTELLDKEWRCGRGGILPAILTRRAKVEDVADMPPSSVTISAWSCVPCTEKSTTSENDRVDSVGVVPGWNWLVASSSGREGLVCANTATRETDAAEGRAVRGGAGESGAWIECVSARIALLGDVVAAVNALTIDPTPYVMPSPDNADPIRPFGVVPKPEPVTSSSTPASSSSDSCSTSLGLAPETDVSRRFRGLPRSCSCPSSSSSGRALIPLRQLIMSSRLREDAEDAIMAATGECEASRE